MLYQLSYAHHIACYLCQDCQMARPAGLEPATIRLEGGCSIQLSYGRLSICNADLKLRLGTPHTARNCFCRLTQRLAVLDKRGECYRGDNRSSTAAAKKIQLFKGVTRKPWDAPLPVGSTVREWQLFLNPFFMVNHA